MKENFLKAIDGKLKVRITWNSRSKGRIIRLCIPFDFGPSQKDNAIDKSDKYHVWDLESPEGELHNVSIDPARMVSIEVSGDTFEPGDYVKWKTSWVYRRDWGHYS
ncbi:MAG: hypothetical protein PHH40_01640 [Candidatus Moranbacteria bacterium]|nr:hypothetical protein [Candidatus Moranbacteria bacterium]MDD3965077.1 hypothetical protein [Candidatus Moranbacteria bacterium]